jgi:ferric-dicitrate binding protein FerR (iron transport regulator)
MNFEKFDTVEDLLSDESFLNYYFQKDENDMLDWEDWQAEVPEREALVKTAFLLLDRLSLKFDEKQIKIKLQQLQAKINAQSQKKTRYSILNYSFFLRIAAAALLLVVGVWYFFSPKKTVTEGGQFAAVTQAIENKAVGKIAAYKLSDGTLVRLNSNSKIKLSENFNTKNRDIFLEGEAYFEVAKNPSKPFRVHAGKSVTTALGTAFTVRAVSGETSVKVVLVEGKVRVENTEPHQKQIKELIAGQQIEIQKDTISNIEYVKNMPLALRWKEGFVMTFRDAPLSEVFKALNENYHTTIVGADDSRWKAAKITAEFDKSMSLSAIMEALKFANDFDFLIRNDSIFFQNKNR